MPDNFGVDSSSLQRMVAELRASTSQLDKLSQSEPTLPVVTTSSEKVGETLSEIMRAAGGLAAAVDDIADKIHASDGSYGKIDDNNATALRREGEGVR
jgi:ABC-type transporter Mla subunit MlaD